MCFFSRPSLVARVLNLPPNGLNQTALNPRTCARSAFRAPSAPMTAARARAPAQYPRNTEICCPAAAVDTARAAATRGPRHARRAGMRIEPRGSACDAPPARGVPPAAGTRFPCDQICALVFGACARCGLVHHSHACDGVCPRGVATALEEATAEPACVPGPSRLDQCSPHEKCTTAFFRALVSAGW